MFTLRFTQLRAGLPWVLLLGAWAGSIFAAAPASVRFDIPAQRADLALAEFAKQGSVEVLFASAELKTVQANAVVGFTRARPRSKFCCAAPASPRREVPPANSWSCGIGAARRPAKFAAWWWRASTASQSRM